MALIPALPPELDDLLTVRQVARTLRLDLDAVYARVQSGAIAAVKLHIRPACYAGCRCPVRIPLRNFRAYLSAYLVD